MPQKPITYRLLAQVVPPLLLAAILNISIPLCCGAADLQMEGFRYIQTKDFSKALNCFDAALKERPDSWQIQQSIGSCHLELGHYDTAISYFQKSIETGGLHA